MSDCFHGKHCMMREFYKGIIDDLKAENARLAEQITLANIAGIRNEAEARRSTAEAIHRRLSEYGKEKQENVHV